MYRYRYHLLLLVLLTALLPGTLLARKKKDKVGQETSLLTLDEQQYFDSLYVLALTQEQCRRVDSAVVLMTRATQFYDSVLTANRYTIVPKLPSEPEKELPKGFRRPTTAQVPGLAAAYFFLSNNYRQQNNAMLSILNIEQAVAIDSEGQWGQAIDHLWSPGPVTPTTSAPFYFVYDKVGDTYYQYTEEKGDIKIGSYEDLIRIINEILSK